MLHNVDLHCFVIGSTGSGKSYWAKKYFLKVKEGVLYFNTVLDDKDWSGWMKVSSSTSMSTIAIALSRGQKIVFTPQLKNRNRDFKAILKILAFNRNVKFRFVIDEVKDLQRDAEILEDLIKLGEFGRHLNTKYVVMSQRLQKINRDISSQCDDAMIFKTNLEKSYFRSVGIDVALFEKEVRAKQYHYAHLNNGELQGIYKL